MEQTPNPPTKKPDRMPLILAIIVLAGLAIFSFVLNRPAKSKLTVKEYAFYSCETAIEDVLKSPSSAEFERFSESNVKYIGKNTFDVNIYVDSQNSFGVMIRSDFICQITFTEDFSEYTAKLKEIER